MHELCVMYTFVAMTDWAAIYKEAELLSLVIHSAPHYIKDVPTMTAAVNDVVSLKHRALPWANDMPYQYTTVQYSRSWSSQSVALFSDMN